MPQKNPEFWQSMPGLIWSNPQADDAVYIRAALSRPRYLEILAIVLEFGLERVQAEWRILEQEPDEEIIRARNSVKRILTNIEKGLAIAAAGNQKVKVSFFAAEEALAKVLDPGDASGPRLATLAENLQVEGACDRSAIKIARFLWSIYPSQGARFYPQGLPRSVRASGHSHEF